MTLLVHHPGRGDREGQPGLEDVLVAPRRSRGHHLRRHAARTDSSTPSKKYDISVIGCGLMGSATARAVAGKGLSAAVWNRTPKRAEAITGDGITALRSVDDAVRSSRLVMACTSTYDTTTASPEPVTDWWGTALVDIGTGSPEGTERAERWATPHATCPTRCAARALWMPPSRPGGPAAPRPTDI
ncbi:NAD(P)-binding domain-containing protein [Streptomyces sp. NPDC005349]|uniref:NAD(P)-binding domain-containing protein n=1 Tax=Streptomyces sp. NPDC005349 TaxID=3157037 RepID=UPI0033BE9F94